MKSGIGFKAEASARMIRRPNAKSGIRLGGHFNFKCFNPKHELKWKVDENNLVVTQGLQKVLDDIFTGAGQTDPWYVGLIDDTPTIVAGDTAAAHGGWTEFQDYDEANRPAYIDVRAGETVSNVAATADFTIDTDTSIIAGAFLVSSNVKGGGGGVLLCAVVFTTGDKSADDNDTLEVTYTFGAVDDGV